PCGVDSFDLRIASVVYTLKGRDRMDFAFRFARVLLCRDGGERMGRVSRDIELKTRLPGDALAHHRGILAQRDEVRRFVRSRKRALPLPVHGGLRRWRVCLRLGSGLLLGRRLRLGGVRIFPTSQPQKIAQLGTRCQGKKQDGKWYYSCD